MNKLSFSKDEAYTLSAIVLVLFFGMAANLSFGYFEWAKCSAGEKETLCAVDFPVDINSAEKQVLEAIPGVGPSLADRIIARREKTGEFKTKCEIRKVSGVGPRMYEKIKDKIYVSGDETPEAENPDAISAAGNDGKARIDLNLASVENFAAIKGIGAKLGKKIVEYREKNGGRIENLTQLSKVDGVGQKRMKVINDNFLIY